MEENIKKNIHMYIYTTESFAVHQKLMQLYFNLKQKERIYK